MSADVRPILYGYWRSSAAYRVRLALGFKGIGYDNVPINLIDGAQSRPDFQALNPQGLVPALAIGGGILGQSLAIIEYLEETVPAPALLPPDPLARALVRSAALVIACDIHPVNNLRIVRYLQAALGHDRPAIDAWSRHWIGSGLAVLERFAADHGGAFLHGDNVTIADLCLVPQLYNARRVGLDLAPFPRLAAIDRNFALLSCAGAAHPDSQLDRILP